MPNQQHAGPGPAAPDTPEPSLAERARTLVSLGRIGSLSTHSRKFPGFPFGSLMPYAADGQGRPVFFISSMAMHTQNLGNDPRASLLIAQPEAEGDPLGAARMTVVGSAAEIAGCGGPRPLSLAARECEVLARVHRLCLLSVGSGGCVLHRRLRRHGLDLRRRLQSSPTQSSSRATFANLGVVFSCHGLRSGAWRTRVYR